MKLKTPVKTIDKRSEVRGPDRRAAHSLAMKAYWVKRKAAEKRAAAKLAREQRIAEQAKLAKAAERKSARQAKRAA